MTKQTTKTTSKTKKSNSKLADYASATVNDFKSALLTVSLLVNAFILVGWIALQITTQYDHQVATFLFAR